MTSDDLSIRIVRKKNADHYLWGAACDGWYLVQDPALSVIYERMPPGTAEVRHFHQQARQLFWILRGTAEFEAAEGQWIAVGANEGLEVLPQAAHRIANRSEHDVEFLVISHPSTQEDRVTL